MYAFKNNLCSKCNYNYYRKEDEALIFGKYFNCYKELEGYYLDKANSLFKKCYKRCQTCEIGGNNTNHNCFTCQNNYPFPIKKNNCIKCYEACNHYYYFDNNKQKPKLYQIY